MDQHDVYANTADYTGKPVQWFTLSENVQVTCPTVRTTVSCLERDIVLSKRAVDIYPAALAPAPPAPASASCPPVARGGWVNTAEAMYW
jgi:hypothetical protein